MHTASGISTCSRPSASPFSTRVISVFCASAGAHRCHGASPPRSKTLTSGSSETARTTIVELACASLNERLRIATAISTAASAAASGSRMTMNSAASRGPYWNIAASVSLRSTHWPGRKLKQLRMAISTLTHATAPHLPATSAQRSAGFISSGSSEPRSRSPAVVSRAALSAP